MLLTAAKGGFSIAAQEMALLSTRVTKTTPQVSQLVPVAEVMSRPEAITEIPNSPWFKSKLWSAARGVGRTAEFLGLSAVGMQTGAMLGVGGALLVGVSASSAALPLISAVGAISGLGAATTLSLRRELIAGSKMAYHRVRKTGSFHILTHKNLYAKQTRSRTQARQKAERIIQSLSSAEKVEFVEKLKNHAIKGDNTDSVSGALYSLSQMGSAGLEAIQEVATLCARDADNQLRLGLALKALVMSETDSGLRIANEIIPQAQAVLTATLEEKAKQEARFTLNETDTNEVEGTEQDPDQTTEVNTSKTPSILKGTSFRGEILTATQTSWILNNGGNLNGAKVDFQSPLDFSLTDSGKKNLLAQPNKASGLAQAVRDFILAGSDTARSMVANNTSVSLPLDSIDFSGTTLDAAQASWFLNQGATLTGAHFNFDSPQELNLTAVGRKAWKNQPQVALPWLAHTALTSTDFGQVQATTESFALFDEHGIQALVSLALINQAGKQDKVLQSLITRALIKYQPETASITALSFIETQLGPENMLPVAGFPFFDGETLSAIQASWLLNRGISIIGASFGFDDLSVLQLTPEGLAHLQASGLVADTAPTPEA